MISPDHVSRLHGRSGAGRWSLPEQAFAEALERSGASRFKDTTPSRDAVAGYLETLHLDDLALACACARGDERAWEHFVTTFRPVLYRVADALAPGGSGRELADALYADLFGLEERDGRRRSLFDYFHGRSTLAAWLRAVLAQRVVDRARETRRSVPLPEEEPLTAPRPPGNDGSPDPDRPRLLARLGSALGGALAALPGRERLRLALYYTQGLTLAETGRALGESEATVSRKLDRTRRELRRAVEQRLREEARLTAAEIASCFEYAVGDWPFDLREALPVPDS